MIRLKAIFLRLSIFKKIYLVYLLCILPFLALLCLAIVLLLRDILFSNIALSVGSNSAIITRRIEDKMQDMENCSNMMVAYLNELDFIKDSTVVIDDLSRYNEILKRITYTTQVFRSVDSMIFIDQNGTVFGQSPQIEEAAKTKDLQSLFNNPEYIGGKSYWLEITEGNSFSPNAKMPTLTMVKNITDIATGERLGMLILALNESSIADVFSQLKLTENSSYFIADREGFHAMPQGNEETHTVLPYAAGVKNNGYSFNNSYYYLSPFKKIPYYVVFKAPLSDITRHMKNLLSIVIIAGILAAGFLFLISVKIARFISAPIVKLTQKMETATKGDLSIRFYCSTRDEIWMLSQGFNEMLDTIEHLIQNIQDEQRAKRKFELALLQSQIKPHFLYNTLDTIYALIYIGRCEDALKTTKSLAEFYRMALSSGAEIVTIGAEAKCLDDYLHIQSVRYSDVFTYSISLPAELQSFSIPKLLIQPLVENAIYHGLREKENQGLLSVTAVQDETNIYITVSDNGVGMDTQQVEYLLSQENHTSFGLKNCNDRIRLYFGTEYGLDIRSCPGKGTDVTIHIPKLSGGALHASNHDY